jgi:hypothetical protein
VLKPDQCGENGRPTAVITRLREGDVGKGVALDKRSLQVHTGLVVGAMMPAGICSREPTARIGWHLKEQNFCPRSSAAAPMHIAANNRPLVGQTARGTRIWLLSVYWLHFGYPD